jgi:hypothetical protein
MMHDKIHGLDDWQRLDMLVSLRNIVSDTPNDPELGRKMREIFKRIIDNENSLREQW